MSQAFSLRQIASAVSITSKKSTVLAGRGGVLRADAQARGDSLLHG
jgi:hypothetical protein